MKRWPAHVLLAILSGAGGLMAQSAGSPARADQPDLWEFEESIRESSTPRTIKGRFVVERDSVILVVEGHGCAPVTPPANLEIGYRCTGDLTVWFARRNLGTEVRYEVSGQRLEVVRVCSRQGTMRNGRMGCVQWREDRRPVAATLTGRFGSIRRP